MASVDLPTLLLLSLEHSPFIDEMYSPLLNRLSEIARLQRAKSTSAAIRYLEANNPKYILATDVGLVRKDNRAVLKKVVSYVRSGGRLVLGLNFSSGVTGTAFERFFSRSFSLPWKRGDYHRTNFMLSTSSSLPSDVVRDSFPAPFSMKASHVQDAQPHQKIFVPVPGTMTQSHVFSPDFVDQSQAAVVGEKVGDGYLFYIGDVNGEEGSNKIIETLCGA
ncbi:MAG: hypothetical protein M1814_005692 [Vezdaea aestivalis]|nr:MAG: hypothetical protein M1814_005692 [Vezdaea aestivalis]